MPNISFCFATIACVHFTTFMHFSIFGSSIPFALNPLKKLNSKRRRRGRTQDAKKSMKTYFSLGVLPTLRATSEFAYYVRHFLPLIFAFQGRFSPYFFIFEKNATFAKYVKISRVLPTSAKFFELCQIFTYFSLKCSCTKNLKNVPAGEFKSEHCFLFRNESGKWPFSVRNNWYT